MNLSHSGPRGKYEMRKAQTKTRNTKYEIRNTEHGTRNTAHGLQNYTAYLPRRDRIDHDYHKLTGIRGVWKKLIPGCVSSPSFLSLVIGRTFTPVRLQSIKQSKQSSNQSNHSNLIVSFAGKLAMTNHPGTTRRAATAVGGKHYQKRVPRWRDRVRVKSMQCATEGGVICRMISVRAWAQGTKGPRGPSSRHFVKRTAACMLQSQIVTSPLPLDVKDGRSMTLFDACNNRKMRVQP